MVDTTSGRIARTLDMPLAEPLMDAVAFSEDDRLLLVTSGEELRVFRVASGELLFADPRRR